MAATDFTSLTESKAVVTGIIPGIDDGELEALLTASAGVDCTDLTTPIYRPYVVAALFIRTRWQQYKRLRSAAGSEIEYASASVAFNSLADLQARYDAGICEIPSAWSSSSGRTVRPVF